MTLAPGMRLGAYEVIASVGRHGRGLSPARYPPRREIALKLLPDQMAGDADSLARYEARLLASLNHPGGAGLHRLERDGNRLFLVMELVSERTLADRVSRGALALDETVSIGRQVAEALEAAHDRGIVHRDLRPANIKVPPEGKATPANAAGAHSYQARAAAS